MIEDIKSLTQYNTDENYISKYKIGDIFYTFDATRQDIRVGEITKVYSPDVAFSLEEYEIYWSKFFNPEGKGQDWVDVYEVDSFYTDVNLAIVEYYKQKEEEILNRIELAKSEIKEYEEHLMELNNKCDKEMLKEKYAEYFI